MPDPEITPAPEPTPAPAPAPDPKPDPSPAPDPAAEKLSQLEKSLKAQEKELEKYRKAEKDKADADKSAAEKLAEREAEIAALKRQTLIDRVRRDGGYASKVFDAVSVSGDDEDAIKSAFETFKASLDAYTKEQGVKSAPGAGTGDAKDPGKAKPAANDDRPTLVKLFNLKDSKAV